MIHVLGVVGSSTAAVRGQPIWHASPSTLSIAKGLCRPFAAHGRASDGGPSEVERERRRGSHGAGRPAGGASPTRRPAPLAAVRATPAGSVWFADASATTAGRPASARVAPANEFWANLGRKHSVETAVEPAVTHGRRGAAATHGRDAAASTTVRAAARWRWRWPDGMHPACKVQRTAN